MPAINDVNMNKIRSM